jgi:hypothetical protein
MVVVVVVVLKAFGAAATQMSSHKWSTPFGLNVTPCD